MKNRFFTLLLWSFVATLIIYIFDLTGHQVDTVQLNPESTQSTHGMTYILTMPILSASSGLLIENLNAHEVIVTDINGEDLYRSPAYAYPMSNLSVLTLLNGSLSGSKIFVQMQPTTLATFESPTFHVGDYRYLRTHFYNKNLLDVYFGFSLMFFGVIVLVSTVTFHQQMKDMAYALALILLSQGYLILGIQTFLPLLYPHYLEQIHLLQALATYCGLFALVYLFKSAVLHQIHEPIFKVLYVCITIYCLFGLGLTIANPLLGYGSIELVQAAKIMMTGPLYTAVSILTFTGLLFLGLSYINKGHLNARIYVYALSVLLLSFFFEALSNLINGHGLIHFYDVDGLGLWKWGTVAFSIILLYLFIAHYSMHYTRYQELANLLSHTTSLAKLDFLTKMPTKGILLETMRHLNERLILNQVPYALIIIDLDNFAQINHLYGDGFGDHVLIMTAQRMKRFVKAQDNKNITLGRWHNDQFLCLLPSHNTDAAYKFCEQLRYHLKYQHFDQTDHMIHITVTMGLYVCEQKEAFQESLEKLDHALHFGKRHGKDCTVCFNHMNYANIHSTIIN